MKENLYEGGNSVPQRLVDIAVDMLRSDTVKELSLRRLAQLAGVSHNAPYRHFADKEELLAAIACRGFSILNSELKQAQSPIGPTLLHDIGKRYVAFARGNGSLYQLMFNEYRANLWRDRGALATGARATLDQLVERIKIGQEAGIIIDEDPLKLAKIAWTQVHGQSLYAISSSFFIGSEKEFSKQLTLTFDILFRGMSKTLNN